MDKSKNISDWKYILLDTSFIIDYLSDPEKFIGNPKKKENIELSKLIMNELSSNNKLQFYVTSITIGELKRLETESIANKIIEVLHSGDVTFLSYGKREAQELNNIFNDIRKKSAPKFSLKEIEKAKKESGCVNYRGWISDDMKILSCAKVMYEKNQLDVILTSDEKTFFPIANFLKMPCRLLNSRYFPKDAFGNIDKEQ